MANEFDNHNNIFSKITETGNGFMNWIGKYNPIKLDPVLGTGEQQTLQQNSNMNSSGFFNSFKHKTLGAPPIKTNKNQQEIYALVRKFFSYLNSRKELLSTLEGLRNNDVVQTIIDVMIDDGFYATSSPKIFDIEFKGKIEQNVIQQIINDLVNEFSLNDLIIDILEDLLLFGEYMIRLDIKSGKGIVDIIDDANLEDMFGIYKGSKRECYLKRNLKGVEKLAPTSYAHFVLSPRKLRVQFQSDDSIGYLPSYIRIGRPVVLNAINKLKQLQILEMGNLALDLKQILAPILVLVGIPATTAPEDTGAIIEQYEKHLSDMFDGNINLTDDIDFSQMLTMASKIKVLPNYSDGKGSIETLQINTDKVADREREESIRRSIASATGVPFYYLSILGETGSTKLESLKVYSRYSRKLNSIQYCVAKGVKEIVMFHLDAMGTIVSPEDITVKMRTIVNVDMLDNMEYLVTIATAIGDFFDNITRITESEEVNAKLNTEKFVKMLQTLLDQIPNAEGLIEVQQPVEIPPADGGQYMQ